jgi:glycosyltransferase involved in cell wall biosynthesis
VKTQGDDMTRRDENPASPAAVVIIPAHDEGPVLDRCLEALLADAVDGEFEVIVAANGCSDDTATVARRRSPAVRVLELPEPGKTLALNAADATTSTFPRVYLDADVVLSTQAARDLTRALAVPGVMAAAPRPHPVGAGVSWPVRWHYDVWAQLPITRDGYVGSGVFALSAAGHARVSPFPTIIAEDAYVRRSFRRSERHQVDSSFDLMPPRNVRALLRRTARSRAGNTQLSASDVDLQAEESTRGIRGLLPLLRRPTNWPKVATFAVLTVAIRVVGARKTRRGDLMHWDRDESSRARIPGATP